MLVICCLTSNAYHAGYALSATRLLKTKRSIVLSDVWFEDFLLVIDVIKPPGTYFNNNNLIIPSLPPSSRAPRVSLAPKTPFPFPFKRLPRRLSSDGQYLQCSLLQRLLMFSNRFWTNCLNCFDSPLIHHHKI